MKLPGKDCNKTELLVAISPIQGKKSPALCGVVIYLKTIGLKGRRVEKAQTPIQRLAVNIAQIQRAAQLINLAKISQDRISKRVLAGLFLSHSNNTLSLYVKLSLQIIRTLLKYTLRKESNLEEVEERSKFRVPRL